MSKFGEEPQHPNVLKNNCFPTKKKWTDELPLLLQWKKRNNDGW